MGLVLKDAHQKSEYLISAKIKSIFSILKELLRKRRFFVVEFSNIRRLAGYVRFAHIRTLQFGLIIEALK